MTIVFVPISHEIAREVLTWRYPPPYDFYDPPGDFTAEQVNALLSQESPQYGVFDDENRLIGVIGTGVESQVPGGDYSTPAVDIGIGLHPDHCGRGLGREVVTAFIDFLEARDGPSTYRATIAAFNLRSLKTFTHLGFTESSRFRTGEHDSPVDWVIVVKEPDQYSVVARRVGSSQS